MHTTKNALILKFKWKIDNLFALLNVTNQNNSVIANY